MLGRPTSLHLSKYLQVRKFKDASFSEQTDATVLQEFQLPNENMATDSIRPSPSGKVEKHKNAAITRHLFPNTTQKAA